MDFSEEYILMNRGFKNTLWFSTYTHIHNCDEINRTVVFLPGSTIFNFQFG